MVEEAETSRRLQRAFWAMNFSVPLYFAAAIACLRQWGSADPWARLDVFSGTYLVLGVLATVALALGFNRVAFRSIALMREAAGTGYDRATTAWGTLLSLAELAVYLDYGHWHLVPGLEQRALQSAGLGIMIVGFAWMLWTDSYLVRHFSGDLATRKLIVKGPYRLVRHPRYLSILAGKAALALVFASVLAWLLAIVWILLLLRRIQLEEAHMRKLFGAEYDAYARYTARLLPGIY